MELPREGEASQSMGDGGGAGVGCASRFVVRRERFLSEAGKEEDMVREAVEEDGLGAAEVEVDIWTSLKGGFVDKLGSNKKVRQG